MKTNKLNLAIALILSGAMTTSVAFAKGKPPVTETATQNLSVPAILVGPLGTLVCGPSDVAPSDLKLPTGDDPLTGYEVEGYYWVQKVHTWQAQCFNATEASVFGNWGDNLTGDAKLSTGSPIRVELVLTNSDDFSATIPSGTLEGYKVIKLQPSLADRLSAYGHQATGPDPAWTATPSDFPQYPTNVTCPDPTDATNPGCQGWVVHDAGMRISVQNVATEAFVVPIQPIAPEINATGKVVYGYNLRVTAAGIYRIRFNSSDAVTFTGVDAATGTFDEHNTYLDIKVTAKAGGGKTGGKPK